MNKVVKGLTVLFAGLSAFTIVSCGEKKETYTAQDFVNLINLEQDRKTVAANFDVRANVVNGDEKVAVSWSSKNEEFLTFEDKNEDFKTAVIHPSREGVKVAEFTATVDYKGEKASKDFKIRIAQLFTDEDKLRAMYDGTYKKGDSVSLNGYIGWKAPYEEKFKNFNVYIIDATQKGGFYAFRVGAKDQAAYDAYKVGQAVTLNGTVDVYNGATQIKDPKLIARDAEALTTFTPNDTTSDFVKFALEGNMDGMKKYTAGYVTIKGVKVTKVNKIGSDTTSVIVAERAGFEVSGSVNKYMTPLKGETAKAIEAQAQTIQPNDYVDLTGYLAWYNGVPQFTLQDVNGIKKVDAPEMTEGEKVANELGTVANKIGITYTDAKSYTLDTTLNEVNFTYALKENSDFFTLEGNTLTVKEANEEQSAVVVITAKKGDITLTREVTISALTKKLNTWEKYFYAEKGTKLDPITGVVTVSNVVEKKGNFDGYAIIQSDEGAYYARVSNIDQAKWKEKFVVGRKATINNAIKDEYNGLHQIKDFSVEDVVIGEKTAKLDYLDLATFIGTESLVLCQSKLVTLTGNLTKEGSNFMLIVGENKIQIRSDYKLGVEPKLNNFVDKKVTIKGVLGWYKSPQVTPLEDPSIVE